MLMRVEPYRLRYCREQMAEFRDSLVQQCLAAHRRNRIRTHVFRNRTMVFFVDVAMIGFGSLSAKFGWKCGKGINACSQAIAGNPRFCSFFLKTTAESY